MLSVEDDRAGIAWCSAGGRPVPLSCCEAAWASITPVAAAIEEDRLPAVMKELSCCSCCRSSLLATATPGLVLERVRPWWGVMRRGGAGCWVVAEEDDDGELPLFPAPTVAPPCCCCWWWEDAALEEKLWTMAGLTHWQRWHRASESRQGWQKFQLGISGGDSDST